MWADHVTVRRRMGCSPYFTVTGTHPLLPLDIAEATYLLPPPNAPLSTTDLIATHAVALQKRHVHLAKLASIEKSLNRKMCARYIGPLIVISRNKGGVYIISELNGSVFDRPIAAFHVIPYFAQQRIDIPPLDELIDITSR